MKKSILIIAAVVTALGLSGFGFVNWNKTEVTNPKTSCSQTSYLDTDQFSRLGPTPDIELFYDVSSRFIMTVSKDELEQANSMIDFVSEEILRPNVTYYSMTVTVLSEDMDSEIDAKGFSEMLNEEQRELIRTLSYSMNIRITAEFKEENKETGKTEYGYCTPHMTIVPEKEAEYSNGKDLLLEYIRQNTKEFTSIIREDQLKPGRIAFTVTKEGKLADVVLTSSSGYPAYDAKVFELVSTMPGTWKSATNSKGARVEQKLIFFFGTMGC